MMAPSLYFSYEKSGATKFDSKTIPDEYAMAIAEHILETDK
jgi:hypothetical protein